MKIAIRLKKVLEEYDLDKPGIMTRLATETEPRIHRHTISRIYNNKSPNPRLDVLEAICKWLTANGVPRNELPHALISADPSGLWEAIAAPGAMTFFLGVYHQMGPRPWRDVAQRDVCNMAKLVQGLSGYHGSANCPVSVATEFVERRWVDVDGWPDSTKKGRTQDEKAAKQIFRRLRTGSRQTSSIMVGSQRPNALVELVVAETFDCDAFRPPKKAEVPFYLLYRPGDHDVPSCFGGKSPPPGFRENSAQPGIYYRDEAGWTAFPWSDGKKGKKRKQDAGVVLIVRDLRTNSLDMAVFGFSGSGTQALADRLLHGPDAFWPPSAHVGGKQIGVYVCEFLFARGHAAGGDAELMVDDFKVIPIESEVLQDYLPRGKRGRSRRKTR